MTAKDVIIQEKVSLAPMTTFGIGGPARFFTQAENAEQLVQALDFAARSDLATFILGGGSNLLVSDRGFDGLVIKMASRGVKLVGQDASTAEIAAAAGEDWESFVAFCIDRKLAGVECLSGIPGLIGGTPIQNVGAYGQDVSETIVSVSALDRRDHTIRTLQNDQCGFAYRSSIFNTTHSGRYVILAVTFSLKRNATPHITYPDLIELFANRVPTLAETREAVLRIRRSKSMVIDPLDPNSRGAGSFFKNPIVGMSVFEHIADEFADVKSFPVDAFHVKIPAAWLIERAGFSKGYARGRVGISANHTLALINRGGATAVEVIALMDEIRQHVHARFSVTLHPEPNFIGFNAG
jgi:UDP-N-acetylmuramate dehydrogenase